MAVSENGVYLCKASFNGKFKGSINCLVLCILPGNWVYLWKIGLPWKFMIHRWLWGYLCKERMMTGCTSCHGFNTRMLPWLQLEFGSERRNLGTFESSRTNSIHLYGWIILEKSHCDVIMKYYIHRRWLVGATIPNWAYLRLVNNCNLSTCMGRVQQEPALPVDGRGSFVWTMHDHCLGFNSGGISITVNPHQLSSKTNPQSWSQTSFCTIWQISLNCVGQNLGFF